MEITMKTPILVVGSTRAFRVFLQGQVYPTRITLYKYCGQPVEAEGWLNPVVILLHDYLHLENITSILAALNRSDAIFVTPKA
jgi:hypothetical protein